MRTYKSNYKYKLTVLIGIMSSVFCAGLGGIFILSGSSDSRLLIFLPAVAIFYFIMFAVPREISIGENGITFRTMAGTRYADFSQIRDIRSYYSSKSLQGYGGDREKAHMLCIIILKEKPLAPLFFGDGICDYKKLHSDILLSLKTR